MGRNQRLGYIPQGEIASEHFAWIYEDSTDPWLQYGDDYGSGPVLFTSEAAAKLRREEGEG